MHFTRKTRQQFDFLFLRDVLAKSQQLPPEISAIIFECNSYNLERYLPIYSPLDYGVRPRYGRFTWSSNNKWAYGVSFTVKRDIMCSGIEVFFSFQNARIQPIVGIYPLNDVDSHQLEDPQCIASHKMVTNSEWYRLGDPVREFSFQNTTSVRIPEGHECRIGFVLTYRGMPLCTTMFGDAKGVDDTEDICNVQWQHFGKRLQKKKGRSPQYDGCPLIRLLC